MSAAHEVNAENLSAREEAVRWVEAHPLRDGIAQSVLFVIARLISDDERLIWPSLDFLSWRTGFSRNAIKRVLGDFRRHGILCDTGKTFGQGGTIVYSVHYELAVQTYPDCLTFEEHKAVVRDERKKVIHTANAGPHRATVNGNAGPHRATVNGNAGPQKATVEPVESGNAGPLEHQRRSFDDATQVFSVGNAGPLEGQRRSSEGPEGLEGLEGLKQGFKAGIRGALIAAQASPLSRTDDEQQEESMSAVEQPAAKQASVEELEAEFRRLCDEGLCTWSANKVEQGTMRERLAKLVRERHVTVGTVREALPLAQKHVGRKGRPGSAAITRAMLLITEGRKRELEPVEDKSFFDRPADEAGTFNAPGNFTLH